MAVKVAFPKVLVGLGNPGREYQNTRHNIGVRLLDLIVQRQCASWNNQAKGLTSQVLLGGRALRLYKALNFMNLCGQNIRAMLDFYHLGEADVLVIHDDLELQFGCLAGKLGGGAAGHNGLRSINQHLGSKNYLRLRIGIGRPVDGDISNWVLSAFSQEQEVYLEQVLNYGFDQLTTAKSGEDLSSIKFSVWD